MDNLSEGDILRQAVADSQSVATPVSSIVFAHLLAADCLSELGLPYAAELAYHEAQRLAPEDADLSAAFDLVSSRRSGILSRFRQQALAEPSAA